MQLAGLALGEIVDNVTDALDDVNAASRVGFNPLGLLELTIQFPEVRA